MQRLFDQQSAEARAINEQIAFDDLAVFQHQRSHRAVMRVLPDLADLPFHPPQAVALGDAPQEYRVQPRIEVVGVVDLWLGLQRELVAARGDGFQAEIAEFRRHAAPQAVQPEMMERRRPRALPGDAERMDVALAGTAPVLERDRELEGTGDGTQEFLLVDLQETMEGSDRRHGGFAHPDRADLLGFHQGDVQPVAELVRQRAAGQPPRGTTAGDDDLADASWGCRWRVQGNAPVSG